MIFLEQVMFMLDLKKIDVITTLGGGHNDLYYVFSSHFFKYPFHSFKDKIAKLFMEAIQIANQKKFNSPKYQTRLYEIIK